MVSDSTGLDGLTDHEIAWSLRGVVPGATVLEVLEYRRRAPLNPDDERSSYWAWVHEIAKEAKRA